jgi:aryl-alcohol dehydrogenase-like predicted oxidoreductase
VTIPRRTVLGRPCAEYVIGGAQLGLAYGVTNRAGEPDARRVRAILEAGAECGLTTVDTAGAYGRSEELIGAALATSPELRSSLWPITKPDLAPGLAERPAADVATAVDAAVRASLSRLAQDSLPLVLLHDPAQRLAGGGVVWDALLAARERGLLENLGVSAYEPGDALEAIADPDVAAVQVQVNALDHRHLVAGVPDAAARAGTALFVRSAYLQGLLAAPDLTVDGLSAGLRGALSRYREVADELGRTPAGLAVAFVRSVEAIAGVVLGAETPEQLTANAAVWNEPPLRPDELDLVRAELAATPPTLTDPRRWASA